MTGKNNYRKAVLACCLVSSFIRPLFLSHHCPWQLPPKKSIIRSAPRPGSKDIQFSEWSGCRPLSFVGARSEVEPECFCQSLVCCYGDLEHS